MYPNRERTSSDMASGQTTPDESDSSDDPIPFHNPVHQRRDSDPFNARGGDYEWPTLTNRDREIFGPHQTAAWELRQQDFDARADWPHTHFPRVPHGLLPR